MDDMLLRLSQKAESDISGVFQKIDRVSTENTSRVLAAFRRARVSDTFFAGTTGYGYDDRGRDALDGVFASVFGCEDALVRIGFVNGTHAIACALFACLRPGQRLLSCVGAPYDTLEGVIGSKGPPPHGSLAFYGIGYAEVAALSDGSPDISAIEAAASAKDIGAVLIQRSRGYSQRPALSVSGIAEICRAVRAVNPGAAIIVDNCYGEFVEEREPVCEGLADICAGSLIKNPGGGLAPTGGYVAGRRELVERASHRLNVPGIGRECGPTLGQSRLLYQGLFMAPHTVAQALKTAVFCARLMELLGFEASPKWDEKRYDIIQSIRFGSPEAVAAFCRGIQSGAPVDSFVTPEPWRMPGYDCDVIMAAGAFIQGASIELSCDAPMREPYTAYMQGGLTFESGKEGVLLAASEILESSRPQGGAQE